MKQSIENKLKELGITVVHGELSEEDNKKLTSDKVLDGILRDMK